MRTQNGPRIRRCQCHTHTSAHWWGSSGSSIVSVTITTPAVARLGRSSQWMSRSQVTRTSPTPHGYFQIEKKRSLKKTTRVRNSTDPRIIVTPSVSVLSSTAPAGRVDAKLLSRQPRLSTPRSTRTGQRLRSRPRAPRRRREVALVLQ